MLQAAFRSHNNQRFPVLPMELAPTAARKLHSYVPELVHVPQHMEEVGRGGAIDHLKIDTLRLGVEVVRHLQTVRTTQNERKR